jgi:hypothetical protein
MSLVINSHITKCSDENGDMDFQNSAPKHFNPNFQSPLPKNDPYEGRSCNRLYVNIEIFISMSHFANDFRRYREFGIIKLTYRIIGDVEFLP